jgi:iron complex outermembrane receptor protein
MDHLIVFESGSYTNLDADTKGVEIALEAGWTNGIKARASYTFQNVNDRSRDREFADSPEHLIKGNLSVPLYRDKVFAGAEFQYMSERDSLHNMTGLGGQPVTVQGRTAAGYGTVNLTLFSRELVKNLEISASLYNLFDQKYSDPATRFHLQDTLERDGRTFRVKATYRF